MMSSILPVGKRWNRRRKRLFLAVCETQKYSVSTSRLDPVLKEQANSGIRLQFIIPVSKKPKKKLSSTLSYSYAM